MANSYNTSQTTITSTNSPTTVFTASSSTTLVKSIRVMHGSASSSATLAITKSGGSRTDMNTVSLSADVISNLITDVMPLAAGDSLTVESTHQPTYVWVSYVENTTSVSGQSIDVLTDVDITTTAPTNGQVLIWNDSANEFQPGDAGGSTATLDDIGNVDTTGKSTNDVLLWNGSNWVDSNRLTELYTQFRSGTNTNIYADGSTTTEGKVELSATGADLKVNITGIEVTETSPGDIEMVVATDASGTTAFTAVHIDGTTTANSADVLIKNGANLKIESASSTTANIRYTGTGNANLSLPGSTGTLALTSDLYTDSDADARIAAASVTDLTDVTSAGSGAIITSAERTKLSGIAAGAEVNVNADWNASSGDAQILNKPALSTVATTGAYSDLTGTPQPYEEDEVVTGQNVTMNTSVSVASNKIVDIMGDALADTSNANTKKFLGFHNGSGVCVIKGMVDAGNSITGASAGSPLWLGASGSFSASAPTTATYYSRVVGYYIGTLVGGEVMCYFDPSRDWVQID